MLKQIGNNLKSQGANWNEVGIDGNKWESEVTRGTKRESLEKINEQMRKREITANK